MSLYMLYVSKDESILPDSFKTEIGCAHLKLALKWKKNLKPLKVLKQLLKYWSLEKTKKKISFDNYNSGEKAQYVSIYRNLIITGIKYNCVFTYVK